MEQEKRTPFVALTEPDIFRCELCDCGKDTYKNNRLVNFQISTAIVIEQRSTPNLLLSYCP